MIIRHSIIISCLLHGLLLGADRITIDTAPYSFTPGLIAYAPEQEHLFISSATADSGPYTLAIVKRGSRNLMGQTAARVQVNGTITANPLFNALITGLKGVGDRVWVTLEATPDKLYFVVPQRSEREKVYVSNPIGDALGQPAKQILAFEGQETVVASSLTSVQDEAQFQAEQQSQQLQEPSGDMQVQLELPKRGVKTQFERVKRDTKPVESVGAFIAVSNSSGTFDGNGSGIAYVQLVPHVVNITTATTQQSRTKVSLETVDATTGGAGNRALPLGLASPDLFIGSPLAALGMQVAMHWDAGLKRLYVGLDVTTSADPSSGAQAIVVVSVANGKLCVKPFALPSAVTGDSIAGVVGANQRRTVSKLTTLRTSTYLTYLIALEGSSAQHVYALPLVSNPSSDEYGMLAASSSTPLVATTNPKFKRFSSRDFTFAAQEPHDAVTTTSVPAQVGGLAVLPGAITALHAYKDAVFVAVPNASTGQEGGIFYSQALFDTLGRINGWTDWQRAGAAGAIQDFALELNSGAFIYTQNTHIFKTRWTRENSFNNALTQAFTKETGGVQGLFDFSLMQPGLQVVTGYQKVTLAHAGTNDTQILSTHTGDVLAQLGPIVAAQLVPSDNPWLVVGGSGGIAVTADPDGSSNLRSSVSFMPLGTFSQVRKLVSTNNYVYVLTQNALVRITISSQAIAQNMLEPLEIITAQQLGPDTYLSDVIVSGDHIILATSKGLVHARMSSGGQLEWRIITLPEGAGAVPVLSSKHTEKSITPVTRLYAISPTGQETGVFNNQNNRTGTIYVLNAYVGFHQAQVYRVTLDKRGDLTLLPDCMYVNKKTFFANLSDYRNFIATDGAVFWATISKYIGQDPALTILPPSLGSAKPESGLGAHRVVSLALEDYKAIGAVIRSPASGAWLTYGDFGIATMN